ncbi:MAG: glycosyltransferase family 2 protein [Anaerolineae bacterium]|nr:glycosyltransferase family 2 protein [Anaerolineae bacterium]MCI0608311.1 glycosyltransferase family 2 protein [Anaerolineae bacterium]
MSLSLTVFVPAYNEEKNLPHCVDAVTDKLTRLNIAHEFLIVNDGSRDKTAEIAQQLSAARSNVRVIHHRKNGGIGAAFVTAIQNARGEWLILIPADLALEPDEIHHYVEAAPDADIVVGLRTDQSDYTILRKIVSWTNIKLVQVLFGMKERQFQYISMYRLGVLRQMDIEYWQSAFFHAEVLIKAKALGKKLVEVEIKYAPRVSGKPTGARLKLILLTVRDLFHFWLRWLRLGPLRASKRNTIANAEE